MCICFSGNYSNGNHFSFVTNYNSYFISANCYDEYFSPAYFHINDYFFLTRDNSGYLTCVCYYSHHFNNEIIPVSL